MLRRNPRKHKKSTLLTCRICGLWEQFCVCALLPRIKSKAELLLIQHSSELLRQSNTGRLAEKMIEPCELISWGSREFPYCEEALNDPARNYLVLYPRAHNRPLVPADIRGSAGEETSLVLLDATWAQAKSMSRRIPDLQKLTFVSLPQSTAPAWKLRRSPGNGLCCTLEAAIRAMEIFEGEAHVRPLEMALELVMTRALHMRGKLNKLQMEKTCAPIMEFLRSL